MEDIIDVDKLALLARIKLDSNEKQKLQNEFEAILGYVSKLKEVDVEGVSDIEASRTVNLENVIREDENPHRAGEFSEDLLREVPSVEKRYARVKNVLK